MRLKEPRRINPTLTMSIVRSMKHGVKPSPSAEMGPHPIKDKHSDYIPCQGCFTFRTTTKLRPHRLNGLCGNHAIPGDEFPCVLRYNEEQR